MLHDLIIKNGKVIDGSGLPGFTATSPLAAAGLPKSEK